MSIRKSGSCLENLITLLVLQLGMLGISWAAPADVLYIGSGDVKTFNANTGQYLGAIGATCDPFNPKLSGPCPAFGMFVRGGQLFVDNSNFNAPPQSCRGRIAVQC